MKSLFSLLASLALCLSACAQFTTEPPGTRPHNFDWTLSAPEKRGHGIGWTTEAARRSLDSDARNFISRAALTDPVQITAVHNLVRDLKKAGVWRKLTAFYPFVGDTASSCSLNLVSSKYAITWNGSLTFDPSGVTGDGTSAYGDTGYAPSMAANRNSFHLYAWLCQNAALATAPLLGAGASTPEISWSYLSFSGGGFFDAYGPNGQNGLSSNFGFGGNFLWQRTNSTTIVVWNDISQAQNTSAPVIAPTVNTIKLFAVPEVNGFYNPGTLRAVSFGSSLTFVEATAYFAAVTHFQTALGRGDPLTPISDPPVDP